MHPSEAGAVGALMVLLMSTGAAGQITGSAHDFSATTWGGGEICLACHTPHNANGALGAPLWNHQSTTASFTTYTSSTIQATMGQPSGTSKLCLSCHDGTVALDNYGGRTTGTNFITSANGDSLGLNLSNDHPVSFTYNAALVTADGGLADPTVAPVLPLLFGGQVECASCHDVHKGPGSAGKLLVMSNAASALCKTCHTK